MLVHDENPRSTWKLAVVEGLIEGDDGLVRVANIRTSTWRTNRPITKLYPLEVCTNETTPPTEDDTSEQTVMVPTPSQNRPRRVKALEARTKSLTLICVYGDCNPILLFTSRKINLDFLVQVRCF